MELCHSSYIIGVYVQLSDMHVRADHRPATGPVYFFLKVQVQLSISAEAFGLLAPPGAHTASGRLASRSDGGPAGGPAQIWVPPAWGRWDR